MMNTPLVAHSRIDELLALAGIHVNGSDPWDMQIHDERLYRRILEDGSLGLGEAYVEGWWDADALDEFIDRALSAGLESAVGRGLLARIGTLLRGLVNHQGRSRAFANGQAHYDIGNDLYTAMLDRRMTYTCGYWSRAADLDKAQEAKLDLVCRKLSLRPGDRVLDIGCGWGSFLKFAAERYGIRGVGITVSKEQVELGRRLCAGLPIDLRLQDYRDLNESFDHIVSLGMFEHVGWRNYRTFMQVARRSLADNGLFLLHTIGNNISHHAVDRWIDRYIFPNALLPSIAQIGGAIEGLFVMEDWHNFGADYDRTLMAWFRNFDESWPRLREHYGDRFYRMWKYYLLSCAGGFRARSNQLWQIVLSGKGVRGGYRSIRPERQQVESWGGNGYNLSGTASSSVTGWPR
jgi:cyclopropane-fatty-acyl-phospholipid synthase